jgi:hypothetical protein
VDFAQAQVQGHTPLHKAAYGGQIALCRWLREELGQARLLTGLAQIVTLAQHFDNSL